MMMMMMVMMMMMMVMVMMMMMMMMGAQAREKASAQASEIWGVQASAHLLIPTHLVPHTGIECQTEACTCQMASVQTCSERPCSDDL